MTHFNCQAHAIINAPQLSSTRHHQRAATCTPIQSLQLSRQEQSKNTAPALQHMGNVRKGNVGNVAQLSHQSVSDGRKGTATRIPTSPAPSCLGIACWAAPEAPDFRMRSRRTCLLPLLEGCVLGLRTIHVGVFPHRSRVHRIQALLELEPLTQ